MPKAHHMDHFTINSDRLEETRAFYAELGLMPGPRPNFASIDGLWLYSAEGKPVLHVIARESLPEQRRGVLDHMAFFSTDLQGAIDWARAKGLRCRLNRAPEPFNTWQMFFFDPNGAEVELDFAAEEPAPREWPGSNTVLEPAAA
jgi:catechol 2,3-dioxygenase-like lactoylglutathione lyase family enzyme